MRVNNIIERSNKWAAITQTSKSELQTYVNHRQCDTERVQWGLSSIRAFAITEAKVRYAIMLLNLGIAKMMIAFWLTFQISIIDTCQPPCDYLNVGRTF